MLSDVVYMVTDIINTGMVTAVNLETGCVAQFHENLKAQKVTMVAYEVNANAKKAPK